MTNTNCGAGISLLVPFRDDERGARTAAWSWLRAYWEHALPDASLVIGEDDGVPFSKTCAFNDAYRKSDKANDVLVMLDADCYIDPGVILTCAERIREARRWNEPLWFIPYRWLYRLTERSTKRLLASSPQRPHVFATPPNPEDVASTFGSAIGHRFGALIQIMPREAFEMVGGCDPRFRGWGGEDVTFLRVLDTIYGTHETTRNEVLTLWHPAIGDVFLRKWHGQPETGANNSLSVHYRKMRRDPARMKAVVHEWLDDPKYAAHRIS